MKLIIYDLDRTSIFCPIADMLDKFIPKTYCLKRMYYMLYPVAHMIEYLFKLYKVNKSMNTTASLMQKEDDVYQMIVTARHKTFTTALHRDLIFTDVDMPVVCIAQGLTGLTKAGVIRSIVDELSETPQIVIYDDNPTVLQQMKQEFKSKVLPIQVKFDQDGETISYDYC